MGKTQFSDKVLAAGLKPLTATDLKILQVNLGYRCNMTCTHCHVAGGPERTEVMDKGTVEQVLRVFLDNPFESLDITGGAPELNPYFRTLVSEACKAGRHVMVRTNLTIFFEEGMRDIPEFYRDQRVEVIASLPYYLEEGVDRVRGGGAFKKSIDALKRLNSLGYGGEPSGLPLSLVYNPQGAFLAPVQGTLEVEYKRELKDRFGIFFTPFTFTNMPLGRFRDFLTRTGNFDHYVKKLSDAFNPANLDGIMCRQMVSVGWDGGIYDCDFNQILTLAVAPNVPRHINDFDFNVLANRAISVDDHCFGCTAGQGST